MSIEKLKSEKAQRVLMDVANQDSRRKLFDILTKYYGNNDSAGPRRIFAMHKLAPDGDITKLKILSEEEAAKGKPGLRFGDYIEIEGVDLENCAACGQQIRNVYKVIDNTDASNSAYFGETCIARTAADLAKCGNSSINRFTSDEAAGKRAERKKKKLEETIEDELDIDAIEQALESDPLNKKRRDALKEESFRLTTEIKDKVQILYNLEKDHINYFEFDESKTLKALDRGGSTVGWFQREKEENRLPSNIKRIFNKFRAKYAEVTIPELHVLRIYQATFRPFNKQAEVGSDEQDLRLFEHISNIKRAGRNTDSYLTTAKKNLKQSLEIVHSKCTEKKHVCQDNIVDYFKTESSVLDFVARAGNDTIDNIFEHAGRTDIPRDVDELFRKKYVSKIDTLKVWQVKEDLKEIRAAINNDYLTRFTGTDVQKVIEEVRQFFDQDRCLWHKELSSGVLGLYDKTLNAHDYKAIKDFMFLSHIGGGDALDNFMKRLPVIDFKYDADTIMTIGRKMKYMDAKDSQEILKGRKYKLVENFQEYSTNNLPLREIVEKLADSHIEGKNTGPLRKFVSEHLPRIREQMEFGLFNEKMVKRLNKYYHQLDDHSLIEEDEELVEAQSLLGHIKGLQFIKYIADVPDIAKRFYNSAAKKTLLTARSAADKIQSAIDKHGGPEVVRKKMEYLQDLVDNTKVIERTKWYKYSMFMTNFAIQDIKVRKEFFELPDPEKLDKKIKYIKDNFQELSQVEEDNPMFRLKLETLVASADLASEFDKEVGYGSSFDKLVDTINKLLSSRDDGKRVMIHNQAVNDFNEAYETIEGEKGIRKMTEQGIKVLSQDVREFIEQAQRSDLFIRVYAVDSKSFDHKDFLKSIGLNEFHEKRKQWFAYAVKSFMGAQAEIPVLVKKIAEYNIDNKTDISLRVEADQRSRDTYKKPEDSIAEVSRQLYESLDDDDLVDATIVRGNEGLSKGSRYFIPDRKEHPLDCFHYKKEQKKSVFKGSKNEVKNLLKRIMIHNQRNNQMYEVEIIKKDS